MDTTKVLDLVISLPPAAQARICKLVLQEAAASITEDGPCELWLENRPPQGWIQAIKAVRTITSLALKDAKDLVDKAAIAPQKVRDFDSKTSAAVASRELVASGAKFSIREAK